MKLTYDLLKTQKNRDEKYCNAFQLILCPVFSRGLYFTTNEQDNQALLRRPLNPLQDLRDNSFFSKKIRNVRSHIVNSVLTA